MGTFKKTKVVMLPTNEKANALWWSGHKLYVKSPEDPTRGELNHLYFLSDEEIKEGDWMYNPEREPSILQCVGKGSLRGWKKIIATTAIICTGYSKETSKTFNDYQYLPQPSQSFIQKFVEEYNKGNVITEVMVEYEPIGAYANPKYDSDYQLKVSKDNTITIRKVKDSWNRDEVIELLKSRESHIDCHTYSKQFIDKQEYRELDKWIQENL